jgi:2-polyprenyl-6-methoxyphenol hydroxylase-like FAD-dependent oxidoreductase
VGSNGASQAILDARTLGAAILAHDTTPSALDRYEATVRPAVNKVVLANRGNGPDAIMQMVEDRCNGDFTRMDEVVTQAEKAAHADRYKRLAGLDVAALNARPSLIAADKL